MAFGVRAADVAVAVGRPVTIPMGRKSAFSQPEAFSFLGDKQKKNTKKKKSRVRTGKSPFSGRPNNL